MLINFLTIVENFQESFYNIPIQGTSIGGVCMNINISDKAKEILKKSEAKSFRIDVVSNG